MTLRLACALLLAGLLVACGPAKGPDRPPTPGDQAVAKVGDQTVWTSDVKREAVAQGLISQGEPLDVSSDLFRRVLDEVIDQKLLAAEAIRRKVDKDPAVQHDIAASRERVLGDALVSDVVEKAVTENAIRGLYDEQLKLAKQSDEFHARQIVVASQADAENIRKLLASGASFDALAMERSTDSETRFKGGDLGYFTADVMPAAYVEALKDAQKGAIVGPVKVDAGWAVLKVEDRRPEAPLSIEEARPQIVRFLTYDQVRDLLERLRGQAKVRTLIGPPQQVPGAPREPASAPPPGAVPAPPVATPAPAPQPAPQQAKPEAKK